MSPSPTPTARLFGVPVRFLALATLTAQNSASILVMRRSRTIEPLYRACTAVLIVELIKIVLSTAIHMRISDMPIMQRASWRRLRADVLGHDAYKLAVPAAIYAIMNNLIYISATMLDAATFQVLYQMKILTTAGFAVLMLGQMLTRRQWFALVMLTAGIALVQLSGTEEHQASVEALKEAAAKQAAQVSPEEAVAMADATRDAGTGFPIDPPASFMRRLLGFFLVLAASLLSGAAGVYFEKILKAPGSSASSTARPRPAPTLWLRNIQLGLFSLPPALLIVLSEANDILEHGFFYGYTRWAVASIALTAVGGLLVAVVVRYADNILKGFATSISIVLSCIASWLFMGWQPNVLFLVGAGAVMQAVFIYGFEESKKKSSDSGKSGYAAVEHDEHAEVQGDVAIEEGSTSAVEQHALSTLHAGLDTKKHARQGSWAGGPVQGLANNVRHSHTRSASHGARWKGKLND